MFKFNSKTYVNKQFKMNELYKQMAADKNIKSDGKVVARVVLANVLSNDTMNYRTIGNVKEIYVFEIELAEKCIPILFVASLDKAISLNTLFVLKYNDEQMLYGAYKEKGEKSMRFSKYYGTAWTRNEIDVAPPLSIASLDALYAALFGALIPIDVREKETPLELIARYEGILSLERKIEQKQKAIIAEKQPKFKFEMNGELQKLEKELEELKGEQK